MGLKVIAYDPHVSAEAAQAAGVPLMSLEELLPQTDILSLHVPETAETRGIVNAHTLALLKPGAILINAARARWWTKPRSRPHSLPAGWQAPGWMCCNRNPSACPTR